MSFFPFTPVFTISSELKKKKGPQNNHQNTMRNLQTFICKTNSYEQESTLQQVGAILKRDRSVLTGVMGTTRRLFPI